MKHVLNTFVRGLGVLALLLSVTAGVQAQTTANPAAPDPMTAGPAPAGKPWEPAWGFWPKAPQYWLPTHWGFVKEAKKGGVDVLFFGDSLTKGWGGAGKTLWQEHYAPLKALNIGIGGDTTRQTLWRLDHDALAGIQPKVVVLMIGVNNIFTATGTDEEIVRGIREILKQIQAKNPQGKILLLGLLPLGNEAQSARAKTINAMLAKLEGGPVRFLDMSAKFQNAEGKILPELYSPDKVHLVQPGYAVWDETMRPVLTEMLK